MVAVLYHFYIVSCAKASFFSKPETLIQQSHSFHLHTFLLKDCQLSVKQVNPRQYVAQIPQVRIP